MIKCKCGKECLCFHDVYLCPQCDIKDIQELAKAYTKNVLEGATDGGKSSGDSKK